MKQVHCQVPRFVSPFTPTPIPNSSSRAEHFIHSPQKVQCASLYENTQKWMLELSKPIAVSHLEWPCGGVFISCISLISRRGALSGTVLGGNQPITAHRGQKLVATWQGSEPAGKAGTAPKNIPRLNARRTKTRVNLWLRTFYVGQVSASC